MNHVVEIIVFSFLSQASVSCLSSAMESKLFQQFPCFFFILRIFYKFASVRRKQVRIRHRGLISVSSCFQCVYVASAKKTADTLQTCTPFPIAWTPAHIEIMSHLHKTSQRTRGETINHSICIVWNHLHKYGNTPPTEISMSLLEHKL